MLMMDTDIHMPKYLLIKEAIIRYIRENDLTVGDRVFSLTDIMDKFEVSKVTAVRALTELENDGYVRREHGRGTFVTFDQPEAGGVTSRRTVAVIVPSMLRMGNLYYAEIVAGLERTLRTRGIALEVSSSDHDGEQERDIIDLLIRERRASGLVIISMEDEDTLGDELMQGLENAPVVVYVKSCPPEKVGRCMFVGSDDFRGGHYVADHLVSLGHKRIGYINVYYGTVHRLDGFRKCLEEHGVNHTDEQTLVFTNDNPRADKIIDFVQRNNLTAIFFINDYIAIMAMKALQDHGYRVPQDISIVGFDNIHASAYLQVPMTTVEQDGWAVGRRTGELLVEALDGNQQIPMARREVVFMPRLIARESTGYAPPEVS